MPKTRVLNDTEKCELISALSNAKTNNLKKSKAFGGDAENAHHREDRADLFATSERFDMWAKLDESFIDAIREGRLVMLEDEEAED